MSEDEENWEPTKVIKFPKPNQRSWAEWEAYARNILRQAELESAAIEWIISDLRPRYVALIEWTEAAPIPISDEATLAALNDAQQRINVSMLLTLIKIEADLYKAKFGDPTS